MLYVICIPPLLLGCDVDLPIKKLIPCLADHLKAGLDLSADTKIEIELKKGSKQWSVTSKTPRAVVSSKDRPGGPSSLELPADGGAFLLELNSKLIS
jgi:hypothetical protein